MTMPQPALNASPAGLRVALLGSDAQRVANLADLVVRLGHEIVAEAAAEVVLCVGAQPDKSVTGKRLLVLGAAAAATVSQLPDVAGAAQIDAALRAVAVGLVVR